MNEDFKPYFKWTEFAFGNNLIAACAQLALGAGAMAAARAAGDNKRARELAAELVKLGAEADTPRDGLRQAKELAGG